MTDPRQKREAQALLQFFNGEVAWVQIDLEKDDHDHLISPEECLRVAMARQ